MTAVLCGNLRAEIVSSAGIRLQRFTSSPPPSPTMVGGYLYRDGDGNTTYQPAPQAQQAITGYGPPNVVP